MTRQDIEKYLQQENTKMDPEILEKIERERMEAIHEKNETLANEYWCLGQIYYIQKDFSAVFQCLKNKKYEMAWEHLEQADLQMTALEQNFKIDSSDDKYHLYFIKNSIAEYEKLFPYEYFLSRDALIKEEKCSICGEVMRLRGGCGHIPGKLYMGELCVPTISNMEYLNLSVVRTPFDRFIGLKPYDKITYKYDMLDVLMESIHSPYDFWFVEIEQELNPSYKNVQRNDRCPCGSGKKFKHCCMNDSDKIYFEHYKLKVMNEPGQKPDRSLKMISWD